MIDAAHRLHLLRCQADFVARDPVSADDLAEIDLLNLICRRKIGNAFKSVKGLSVAMFRRNQFGGGCDAGSHLGFFRNSNGRPAALEDARVRKIISWEAFSSRQSSFQDAEPAPTPHPRAMAGQRPGPRSAALRARCLFAPSLWASRSSYASGRNQIRSAYRHRSQYHVAAPDMASPVTAAHRSSR